MNNFIKQLIFDIKINLTDEFDRNFERKAFFDQPWESAKSPNKKGSLMMRTGKLRRSIKASISNNSINWSSALPYASIHNEGGVIVVTEKMKRFFWAMYYEAAGAVSRSIEQKDGSRVLFVSSDSKSRMAKQAKSSSQRNKQRNDEAAYWKSLALQKTGTKMKFAKRQFIGDHPEVRRCIEKTLDNNLNQLNQEILNKLKK